MCCEEEFARQCVAAAGGLPLLARLSFRPAMSIEEGELLCRVLAAFAEIDALQSDIVASGGGCHVIVRCLQLGGERAASCRWG